MGIPNCLRSSKIERISLYNLILNPYLSVAPPLLQNEIRLKLSDNYEEKDDNFGSIQRA